MIFDKRWAFDCNFINCCLVQLLKDALGETMAVVATRVTGSYTILDIWDWWEIRSNQLVAIEGRSESSALS